MSILRAFVDSRVNEHPPRPSSQSSFAANLAASLGVRAARGRDAEALVHICLGWNGAPAHQNPDLLLELWNQTLSDDDSSVYLAYHKDAQVEVSEGGEGGEVSEVVVGFVHVTYQARPARLGWRATLEELHTVVTPDSSEAVARALIAAVVHECRRRGDVIALYLLTQPDLEPHYSESMYAELGFVPRGRDVLIWQGQLLE